MVKEAARENAAAITNPANAMEVDGHIYYSTVKKQTINGRQAYLHIYYDRERAAKKYMPKTLLCRRCFQAGKGVC